MPPPDRPFVKRAWESSVFQIAYAVRFYVNEGGYSVCDLRNPDNGFIADGCLVMGSSTKPINAPREKWDNIIDPAKHPLVCFGVLPDGQGNPLVFDLAYPRLAPGAAGQHTATSDAPTERDSVQENGGSRVTLKEDGKVYIAAGANVTVVLANGATMNVVDDNGEEHAALAGPTYNNDQALATVVNAIEQVLASLTVNPSNGAVTSPTPLIPSIYQGTTAFGFALAKLQSALLRLSSKNNEVA